MEGFGQFCAAFFVLVIPYMGLRKMFYLPTMLCIVSCSILFYEHRRDKSMRKQLSTQRREMELRHFDDN